MKNTTKLFFATALISASQLSHANCNDGNVEGLPRIYGATCFSDAVIVPHSSYMDKNNPPCPRESIGPSIPGVIQQSFSSGAGQPRSTDASCKALSVHVPPNYEVVGVLGVAEELNGRRTYCGPGNECGGIGWSAMDQSVQISNQWGTNISVNAKNWSGDRTRKFELFVYARPLHSYK